MAPVGAGPAGDLLKELRSNPGYVRPQLNKGVGEAKSTHDQAPDFLGVRREDPQEASQPADRPSGFVAACAATGPEPLSAVRASTASSSTDKCSPSLNFSSIPSLVATLPSPAVSQGCKGEVSGGAKVEGHSLNVGPPGGCGTEATPGAR